MLQTLGLIYLFFFQGVHPDTLGLVLAPLKLSTKSRYNETLIDRIIHIITLSCHTSKSIFFSNIYPINFPLFICYMFILDAKVRLVTLELATKLLTQLVMTENENLLQDCHLAAVEGAKEQSTALLRNFYKVKKWKIGITKFLNACCMLQITL